jgi:invasion protein IalB
MFSLISSITQQQQQQPTNQSTIKKPSINPHKKKTKKTCVLIQRVFLYPVVNKEVVPQFSGRGVTL